MTTNDYIWLNMTTYKDMWLHMTTYDYISLQMTTYGFMWLHMTTHDYLWLQMTTSGYIWWHVTTYEHVRLHMTTYDYIWLQITTSGVGGWFCRTMCWPPHENASSRRRTCNPHDTRRGFADDCIKHPALCYSNQYYITKIALGKTVFSYRTIIFDVRRTGSHMCFLKFP